MNESRKFRYKMICAIMAFMIILSVGMMSACTSGDSAGSENEASEEDVRAADPMTEEELEADDSDGCIEDSEDLLY